MKPTNPTPLKKKKKKKEKKKRKEKMKILKNLKVDLTEFSVTVNTLPCQTSQVQSQYKASHSR